MFKKYFDVINAKIDEICERVKRLEEFFKGRIKREDREKQLRFKFCLIDDLYIVQNFSDKITSDTIFRISFDINEIAAFIAVYGFPNEEFSELFYRTIIEYRKIYLEKNGHDPACYEDWIKIYDTSIKNKEKVDANSNA